MRALCVQSGLIMLFAVWGCGSGQESTRHGGSGEGGSGQGGSGQGSSGQGAGGQGGSGGAVECVSVTDCPLAVSECRTAIACENGQCFFQDTIEGTAVSQQVLGDCSERVCDGKGYTTGVAAPTDVPDDGNLCTLDECNGSLPVHTVQMGVDVPCYGGPAGSEGVGICKGGMAYCDAQGQAGPCVGDVLPQAETCDAALVDEDCDGKVNDDGTNCFCGDGYVSVDMGEECDDGAALDGDPCSPTCKEQKLLQVSGGSGFTCARLSGGRVKCWGLNWDGQLGLQDMEDRGDAPNEMGAQLPFVDLGTGNTAQAIASASHTCALLPDGRVKCWGLNSFGRLGLGDMFDRGGAPNEMGDDLPSVDLGTGKSAIAVTAGHNHSCALLDDGAVKCWAYNADGRLGLGHNDHIGDGPNEMGDSLPAVDLGSSKTATAIAAGGTQTCALLSDGSVKCWGYNGHGQLGLGHNQNIGDEPNEMGDNLPAVDLGSGTTATAIATGEFHTCALLDDGRVKCWGWNYEGEIGLGDAVNRGDGPNEMGDSLPTVDLGIGTTATAIAAGRFHTCALLGNGSVKCWGANWTGRLGLGDADNRGDEPNEMGDNLPAVNLGAGKTAAAIWMGYDHGCAMLDDGALKCWGSNSYGRLGLGDTQDRGIAPGQMGDALPTVKLFSSMW